MHVDLVTPAYKAAAAFARRAPRPVVDALGPGMGQVAALPPSGRRRMVERHQRRIQPHLNDAEVTRQARRVYSSYGRYYGESFRLPAISLEELDARFTHEGYEHILAALDAGTGPILAMPHLGSWEWAGYWIARVQGYPVTVVAERIEPPALFDWFVQFRREIGMNVVALGPDAGRELVSAIKQRHIVSLLCDRNVAGRGVEVTFFGERTFLPPGPAVLALRTGAPVLPTAIYDRGRDHHGYVRPPLSVQRQGSFREDVGRLTQAIADELEQLIRSAPEQWHMLQPNWPSDRDGE